MSGHAPLGAPIATPQTRPLGWETRVRIPAALDALIAAIFARLEQLLARWQAGTLPTPQPSNTVDRPAHPRSTRTPPARRKTA